MTLTLVFQGQRNAHRGRGAAEIFLDYTVCTATGQPYVADQAEVSRIHKILGLPYEISTVPHPGESGVGFTATLPLPAVVTTGAPSKTHPRRSRMGSRFLQPLEEVVGLAA